MTGPIGPARMAESVMDVRLWGTAYFLSTWHAQRPEALAGQVIERGPSYRISPLCVLIVEGRPTIRHDTDCSCGPLPAS